MATTDDDGTAASADLDALLRDADPLSTSAGRGRARHLPVHDIREAVMTQDQGTGGGSWWTGRRPRTGGTGHRVGQALAVAAAVVAVAGATTVVVGLPGPEPQRASVGSPAASTPATPSAGPSSTAPTPSSPATEVAPLPVSEPPAAPRENYLLGEEWQVVRVDEYGDASGPAGETDLVRADGASVQLTWRPAATHETFLEDRRASAADERQVTVDGGPAVLVQYDTPVASPLDLTVLWLVGDRSYELRGTAASPDEFEQVLTGLVRVDAATWVQALPPGAVTPDESAEVVAAMLEDVPLPPGTAPEDVVVPDGVRDEYQVGALVMGTVACGWISEWVVAVDAGDTGAAQEAVDAMATSRGWGTLERMAEEGAYPEVVWEYADAVAGTGQVPGGSNGLTVEDTYQDALGC